jgi:hypothetical protein
MIRPAPRPLPLAPLAPLALCALLLAWPADALDFAVPESPDQRAEPPPSWPFRPQSPDNARGQPPRYQPGAPPMQPPPGAQSGYPGYGQPAFGYPGPTGPFPGQYPRGYPQQGQPRQPSQQPTPWPSPYPAARPGHTAAPRSQRPPRLEIDLDRAQPYLMERVLARVRLISDGELSEATPEPPNSDLALWERIGDPTTRRRTVNGRQEIVTELTLILTPLRTGDIKVPPLTVVGAEASRPAQPARRFELESEPIALQVRPPMASVRPWLPLTNLALKGSLDSPKRVKPGEPVTLMLQLDAIGATGEQLPSLAPQLREADLRVYPEQTLTSAALSRDGRQLEGQRIEYYTLIPQSGGRLQLPEIQLAWWNTATGSREVATMPIRTLGVEGRSASVGALGGAEDAARYWLPVAGLALLLVGYWTGAWYRGRTAQRPRRAAPIAAAPARPSRLRLWQQSAANATGAGIAWLRRRLDPRPLLRRLRARLGGLLPRRLRLLLALRTAQREPTPAAWYERIQELTPDLLPAVGHATTYRMADRLLNVHPNADRARIEHLLRQLEGTLYGGQDIDFPRWKRQLRREILSLAPRTWRGRQLVRRAALPPLNPST